MRSHPLRWERLSVDDFEAGSAVAIGLYAVSNFAREDRSSSRRGAPFASRSLRDLADLPALVARGRVGPAVRGMQPNAWTTGRLTLLAVTPLAPRTHCRSSSLLTARYALRSLWSRTHCRSSSLLTRTLRERILRPPPFPGVASQSTSAVILRGKMAPERDDLPALLRGAAWAQQCEGCDLNAWTPTGADLESAAVSRLGYPRTHSGTLRSGG